jgi:serine/threonine-protein kinase
MNRDQDFTGDEEDVRTWHQPLVGPGSGRSEDQRTSPDSPAAVARAANAPDHTSPELTSPPDVSQFPSDSTDSKATASPDKTQAPPRDSSSSMEWGVAAPTVFAKGEVVFGKYRLLEKIGEGGMGEVWRVWHVDLESERALKLIKAEIAQNDKGWRRFKREAQLMAKINHPNAVSVYDFKRTQSVGYIEMEFVRGRSLADLIKERRDEPMPVDWTASVLDQLCAVLQEAHGHLDEKTGKPKPIIHRDLKPSNLMLVDRKDASQPPRLKVLDFGIAKMVEDEGSPEMTGLTGAGDLIGTPAYMSPEQIQGGFELGGHKHELDGRSDLYSTGVVLYHLLTGTLPFRGNKMTMLAAHLNNQPLAMKEANSRAQVPSGVERVVMQCLEKDPAKRPQTARELAERFRHAAGLAAAAAPRPRREAGMARAVKVAAAAALVIGLTAALVPLAKSFRLSGAPISTPANPENPKTDSTNSAVPQTTKPVGPQTASSRLFQPEGFAAVDSFDLVDGAPNLPRRLTRSIDGAVFTYFKDGVYLPDGYEPDPKDPENREGGVWPRVIVRKSDQIRFIRIPGARYRRGDTRKGGPRAGLGKQNALTPHYVKVPDFYIQETEVTNKQIREYLKVHRDDSERLSTWSRWFDDFKREFKISEDTALDYPAVCIDYRTARLIASWLGGFLPTEAEWEWTAKSCQDTFVFPWGVDFPGSEEPLGVKLNDPRNAADFHPVAVKKSKRDRTEQGVYDMVGNVSELCADVARPYAAIQPEKHQKPEDAYEDRRELIEMGPTDPAKAKIKVIVRGGSFMTEIDEAMVFLRDATSIDESPGTVGFRVVIECPPRPEDSSEVASGKAPAR